MSGKNELCSRIARIRRLLNLRIEEKGLSNKEVYILSKYLDHAINDFNAMRKKAERS